LHWQGATFRNLGAAYQALENLPQASRALKALEHGQQIQDRLGEGNALLNLANSSGRWVMLKRRLNTSNSVWLFSRQTVAMSQGKRCTDLGTSYYSLGITPKASASRDCSSAHENSKTLKVRGQVLRSLRLALLLHGRRQARLITSSSRWHGNYW